MVKNCIGKLDLAPEAPVPPWSLEGPFEQMAPNVPRRILVLEECQECRANAPGFTEKAGRQS